MLLHTKPPQHDLLREPEHFLPIFAHPNRNLEREAVTISGSCSDGTYLFSLRLKSSWFNVRATAQLMINTNTNKQTKRRMLDIFSWKRYLKWIVEVSVFYDWIFCTVRNYQEREPSRSHIHKHECRRSERECVCVCVCLCLYICRYRSTRMTMCLRGGKRGREYNWYDDDDSSSEAMAVKLYLPCDNVPSVFSRARLLNQKRRSE